MRIGVDATTWSNRRGYGRYTRGLLTAALELDQRNQYTFFVDDESEEFPLPSGVEIRRVATKVPTIRAAAADSRRSLLDLWAVAQAVRRAHVDLIYFPTDYSYVPLFMGIPRIVTIHDAIAELFPELVFPTLRSRLFYRAKIRAGIWQARLLITVSEYSRRQLVEKLKIPPARLRIVSEAADPVFRPVKCPPGNEASARWGIPLNAKCLVYIGGFSPHKNLFMLLDVVRELAHQDAFHDLRLVLVGDYVADPFYSCYQQLSERVRLDHLEGRVLFPGRLDDEDLVILLNRADALVLPSFCEGFGLPGIEAAACGTAVVATTESPLPELLGEGLLAVDPRDRSGWIRAIERILSDAGLCARIGEAALAAAQRLSWRNAARQLLSVFDEVQGDPHASA
jgi:glycosyltransferase involved in cell wall biosynthesis